MIYFSWLQRYIFHYLAIQSNPKSVLLFEEPEAHVYPVYIKLLAELIGNSKERQFFITTHHPLFLTVLMEKAGLQNVNLIQTRQTKDGSAFEVSTIEEMEKIFEQDYDAFFQI